MTTEFQGPFQIRHRIGILRVTRKLIAAEVIKPGMSQEDIVDAILAGLIEDDPATYGEQGFNWQALLDLIVKMLPLLLALFGL